MVDDEADDYQTEFDGMYDGSLYSFRILAVDDTLNTVAKTAEVRNSYSDFQNFP